MFVVNHKSTRQSGEQMVFSCLTNNRCFCVFLLHEEEIEPAPSKLIPSKLIAGFVVSPKGVMVQRTYLNHRHCLVFPWAMQTHRPPSVSRLRRRAEPPRRDSLAPEAGTSSFRCTKDEESRRAADGFGLGCESRHGEDSRGDCWPGIAWASRRLRFRTGPEAAAFRTRIFYRGG